LGCTSIPKPEREKIKLMHVAGYNYTELAEFFGRDWKTIKRITTEQDMKDHVEALRREWFGYLGPVMRAAVYGAITNDPKLAYVMVRDAGIVPEGKQNIALGWQTFPGESDDEAKKRIGQAWIEGAFERAKYFELPMPEVDLDIVNVEDKNAKEQKANLPQS
jgi:hypothetical protein